MKVKSVIVLVVVAAAILSCTAKMPEENPAALKKVIIAKVSVKPEKVSDFAEAARGIIEKTNKESGCTFYQLYQNPYDSTKFVFVEEYKNQAAVDAHFSAEYFKAFGPEIGDLVTGPPEIKIVTVSGEVVQ